MLPNQKITFLLYLVRFNILGLKSLDIGGKNINFASVIRNNILRYGRKSSRFKHSPDAGCASIPPQFSPILPQFSSDIHLIFTIFHFLTLNICVYRIKPLLLHNNILMCNRLIKGKASLCQYPKQDKNW